MDRASPATTLFPLMLAGFLAGMSYWLELASRPTHSRGDGSQRHDPDYIVENFQVRRFDDAGLLQNTLLADSMRHYPDDDTTVVARPRLTYHRAPPTAIVAREGRIDGTGEHVELIDEVRVTRAGAAGKPPTVLTTTRLDAYPEEEVARTSVPVTIVQGKSNITGNSMSADNKTGTYVLDGAVRGVFHRLGGGMPASGTMSPVPAVPPKATARAPAVPVVKRAPPKAKTKARPAAKPKPQPKAKPKR